MTLRCCLFYLLCTIATGILLAFAIAWGMVWYMFWLFLGQ